MSAKAVPVVTIDGPGGSGKGTVSQLLAQRLGWNYLDSGALYRLVALAVEERGVTVADAAAIADLAAQLDVRFEWRDGQFETLMDGAPVSARLRSESVSALASHVAAIPEVRSALIARQRAYRQAPGLVADGRDMGTVIFPAATLKIFLTASVAERAQRRYKQLKDKGENVTLSRLFRDIEKRDTRDRTRPVAPLIPANDAHIIDSTELGIIEVLERILKLLEENQVIC